MKYVQTEDEADTMGLEPSKRTEMAPSRLPAELQDTAGKQQRQQSLLVLRI